jgi:large subunit ribosomal protein L14
MIQTQIYLNLVDNNGAQKLMCIRILGASNWKYAHIGEVIITMVKKANPNMPFKNLEVVRAIVVCICKTLVGTRDLRPLWSPPVSLNLVHVLVFF